MRVRNVRVSFPIYSILYAIVMSYFHLFSFFSIKPYLVTSYGDLLFSFLSIKPHLVTSYGELLVVYNIEKGLPLKYCRI